MPGPRDLLVEVRAISVNPVDTKVRRNTQPGRQPKVLGWDVAGVVVGVGSEVSLFKVGDEVFYAGSIARAGGEQRTPSGGRAHRRTQAAEPELRRGRSRCR